MMRYSAGRFQVLSLSGGGYCGLYTARVLAKFEEYAKKDIYDCFDFFAGTSIGGIIAIALALEISAAQIADDIEKKASKIFRKSCIVGRYGVFRSRYSIEDLKNTVQEIVGDKKCIRDAKRGLLIPAVTLQSNNPCIFRSDHRSANNIYSDIELADVAVATAAAPIYFAPAKIKNAQYVDGGVVANSPSLLAIHEVEKYLGIRREDIFLMSVGTTASLNAFASKQSKRYGLFGWIKGQRIVDLFLSSQMALAEHLTTEVLGNRYVSINQWQSADQKKVLKLDNTRKIATDTLNEMAQNSADMAINRGNIIPLMHHTGLKIGEIRPM